MGWNMRKHLAMLLNEYLEDQDPEKIYAFVEALVRSERAAFNTGDADVEWSDGIRRCAVRFNFLSVNSTMLDE